MTNYTWLTSSSIPTYLRHSSPKKPTKMLNISSNDIVILMVKSQFSTSERRFSKSTTIEGLYKQLEPITGRVHKISLNQTALEPGRLLGFYSPQDYDELVVEVDRVLDYDNVAAVEKIVMEDSDYDKRTDSVR